MDNIQYHIGSSVSKVRQISAKETMVQSCIKCSNKLSLSRRPSLQVSLAIGLMFMLNLAEATQGLVDYHQHHQFVAQSRVGGLDPNDYVDEAGELEVMANQQQISTAQLMSAAGHIVPENFFLPGGSIPAIYQHKQAQTESPQQVRHSGLQAKYTRPGIDLIQAASGEQMMQDGGQIIDFNGYNLIGQPDGHDSSAQAAPIELAEFLNPSAMQHFEQQQQQQQQYLDQDNSPMASEPVSEYGSIGPAYQISGVQQDAYSAPIAYEQYPLKEPYKTYGLPTKSSSKEPSGMLKPLGNPKLISSPILDFATSQLPKNTAFEKLAEKLPSGPTPTVFSFSSSKDPMDKVKTINQKTRHVMRQAEHLAKSMIKSVNEKFGTNIGEHSDLPFLLSSIGPLGMAQNILFDPTLLVTLLNSAEKSYFSDGLPGPAKMAFRPVLNIFRVPNRKKDKANLLNIISYLASGGQIPSSSAVKHNRPLGVEKQSASKKSK